MKGNRSDMKVISFIAIYSLLLPGTGFSEESCNGILRLGLYNVTHTASATDAQSLAISNFCMYNYSSSSITTSQKAQIEGSYGIASGGASGSASREEIIQKQEELCVYGFNSSKYSSSTSSDSRIVNNATLDAWNRCQELKNRVLFDVQPYSSLQGVGVTITAPPGLSGTFHGVNQIGIGRSDCTTSSQGKLIEVSQSTPFSFDAANKVTISCNRKMEPVGDEFFSDQQDLEFITSAGNFFFALEATGSLSRMTVDRLEEKLKTSIEAPLKRKIRVVSIKTNRMKTSLDSELSSLETDLASAKQSIAALESSAVRFDSDYYIRFNGGAANETWDLNLLGYQMFEGSDVVLAGRNALQKWRIER